RPADSLFPSTPLFRSSDGGRADFAAAYAEQGGLGASVSGERRRRAAGLLADGRGRLTPAALRAILRDHYENGPIHRPRPADDPRSEEHTSELQSLPYL